MVLVNAPLETGYVGINRKSVKEKENFKENKNIFKFNKVIIYMFI